MSEANRQTESKAPCHLRAAFIDGRRSRRGPLSAYAFSLIVALVIPALSQVSRNFPDKKSEITSPDGQYSVQDVDHNEEYRLLFLKNKTTGETRQVYEYTRGASVVWSPDSRHFAIDDAAGSDYTETKILSVEEAVPEIDVQQEIRDKIDVPSGHHEYFYVAYWIDARRVVVYHWGYGGEDPNGFCECYVYRMNGRVYKCARQPKNSDSVCERSIP